MFLFSLDVVPINPPSVSDFLDGGFLEAIKSWFEFIFVFFGNIIQALTNFYGTLVEINTYVIKLGDSASSGVTNGLPVLETVGAYRYIVTDPVFYFTYILVLSGCLFTIYKLIMLLVKAFMEMKKAITGNGKTTSGLMAFIAKLFQ